MNGHDVDRPVDRPDMPEELRPDPAEVARLLAALAAIPRAELPDGKARDVLAYQIRLGHVDNLYTPLGCDHHNISWGDMAAWMDPRQRVTDWVAGGARHDQTNGQTSDHGGEAQ